MIAFVDSSVLLRIVLGQEPILEVWKSFEHGVVSRVAEVECLRTLDRVRLHARPSDTTIVAMHEKLRELLDALEIIDVSRVTLSRASQPFPTSLATLDSIHLATALLWREENDAPIVFATHDHALALAARASGFPVVGV